MGAKRRADDEFEVIAERALQEMARVEASVADYRDGLKTLIHLAETALHASREMDEDDDV